jgi:hypothetical protein
MASLRTTCCAVLTLATATANARAEPPPESAEDAAVTERLAWLERVLDREALATNVWRGSWIGFYGAATVVEGVLLGTAKTRADRVNDGVGVGKAAIACGFTIFGPSTAAPAARITRKLPAGTRAERLAKLRLAESYLHAIADEERDRRGWFPLIGGALLNAGGGWITWAANKGAGVAGWFGVASGLALAQIQFHTSPTGAIRALEAYRRAGAGGRLGDPPPVLRWSIRPTAGGMLVEGAF